MHDINLITTIAFGLSAALVCGLIAKLCGLSPIVGYLIAGMVVGPYTPGFVGDVALAKQLAEIGVILLMFGVGLHFHFHDLMAVRNIAIPGALGQSLAATLCGLGIAVMAGWGIGGGTVLGIAISVASTVVLLRVLMDHGLVETAEGRVAVGWLVVEDIITVLVLVLLPALATNGHADSAETAPNIWVAAGVGRAETRDFRRSDGVSWCAICAMVVAARRATALERVVYVDGPGDRDGRCDARLYVLWRIDGVGSVSRRHGRGTIEVEPSSRGGRASDA